MGGPTKKRATKPAERRESGSGAQHEGRWPARRARTPHPRRQTSQAGPYPAPTQGGGRAGASAGAQAGPPPATRTRTPEPRKRAPRGEAAGWDAQTMEGAECGGRAVRRREGGASICRSRHFAK